jgi:hypothetical protein
LTTPTGHNPIIKLFSATNQAAIDATANMNSGTGTAIRLKWDNSNYVYVSTNQITFYLGGVGVFNVTPSGVFFNGVNISGGNVVPVFG